MNGWCRVKVLKPILGVVVLIKTKSKNGFIDYNTAIYAIYEFDRRRKMFFHNYSNYLNNETLVMDYRCPTYENVIEWQYILN